MLSCGLASVVVTDLTTARLGNTNKGSGEKNAKPSETCNIKTYFCFFKQIHVCDKGWIGSNVLYC